MDIMEGSQDFTVDYYFSKRIKDQVNHRHEAVFLSDRSMILDQLKGKGYDLVIIGTVHRYFNTFLAVTKRYNTAVISHNLNFIKASKLDLMKSVFKGDVIFRLKLWLKEGLFYKTKVYNTSRTLFVLDEALISGRYHYLPLFYTRDFDKAKNEKIELIEIEFDNVFSNFFKSHELNQKLKYLNFFILYIILDGIVPFFFK